MVRKRIRVSAAGISVGLLLLLLLKLLHDCADIIRDRRHLLLTGAAPGHRPNSRSGAGDKKNRKLMKE